MTPDEARAAVRLIGAPVEDKTERVSWEMPEELKGEDVPAITRGLWYASRLHGEVMGAGSQADADNAFEILRYIFEPPQNEEEWAAYREWATGTASWSEMPKGAMGVELPADLVGTIPGIYLGARDIIKDFANGEASWWNLFDLAGVLPIIGLPATVRKLTGNAGEIAKAARRGVRAAKMSENVRLARVVRPNYIDTPGSRAGVYVFDTPKGQVEVTVEPPGQHNYVGDRNNPTHRITGMPEGEDIADPAETIWTSIKMSGGSYARGYEGTLGNAITREIFTQLGDIFPEARYIAGNRVTGSATGPAARLGEDGVRRGVHTWVYMGDRSRANAMGANRQLLALAEADPEAFARVVAEAAKDGRDISLPVLRQREAEQLARGIPYQLTPIQLKRHEREVERIAMGYDDWAEAETEIFDYLEGVGIEARDSYGEPTTLGRAIVEGALNPRESSVSDILNPAKVEPEQLEKALNDLELAGVNPRTGAISQRQRHVERVRTQMVPRIEGLLRSSVDDVDRVVFTPAESTVGGNGFDIINAFDSNGDNILHMTLRNDQRYYSGIAVHDLQSPTHGEAVTEIVADNLRRADVGLSPSVQDMTSTARRSRAAAAMRRPEGLSFTAGVPDQPTMEYAARMFDRLAQQNPGEDSGRVLDVLAQTLVDEGLDHHEADAIVDALGAVDDGREMLGYGTMLEAVRGRGQHTLSPDAQRVAERLGEQEVVQTGPARRRPRPTRNQPQQLTEQYRDEYRATTGRDPTPEQIETFLMNSGVSGGDARRAARVGAWWQQLDPEVPDDRYISVYRRHTDPEAPLDPNRPASRTNREGAERRRREANPEIYHPRTPMYVKGQVEEAQFSSMPIQIEARIPESRVYDIHADPKGYVQRYRDGELDGFTEVEDLIFRDGDYAALADYERGQVWFFMEPQETHRVNLQTGQWLDNSGQRLDPNISPLDARGIRSPSEGELVGNWLGITEAQQRSRIRQGTAARYEQEAWPALTQAEAGGPAGSGLRRLWTDTSGEKVIAPGADEPPERVVRAATQDLNTGIWHEGPIHGAIEETVGLPADQRVEGFVTDRGRYVDRDEARELARQYQPVPEDRPLVMEDVDPQLVDRTLRDARGRGVSGRGGSAFRDVQDFEVTDWDRAVAEQLSLGEGVSIRLDGKPLPQNLRYVVSPDKGTETIFANPALIRPEDVARFRTAHADALGQKGAVFGAWVDDGQLYMDVSRGFSNRKQAMAVAQTGDQMSIADRKYLPRATGGLADEADWDNAFISNELYDAELGRTRWPSERERVVARRTTYEAMPELGAAMDEKMLRSMGPQTREWYDNARPHVQERVRDMYRMMMSDEELATIMALGQQTRGWYENAARTIKSAFGAEDAPQFTALLAATSPNAPVDANVRFALDLWHEWVAQGRPRDPDFIQDLFNDVYGGTRGVGGHQAMETAAPNVIEVLSHPEPYEWFSDPQVWAAGDVLSGTKVDPFFANLMGELRRATIDTHMLALAGQSQEAGGLSLSRRAAMEAALGGAGEELARVLEMPEALKQAQAQEMIWEPIRQMKEMTPRGMTTEDFFFDPETGAIREDRLAALQERMRAAQDFDQLFRTEEAAGLIRGAGGNPDIPQNPPRGLGPYGEAAATRPYANPEHVRSMTRLIDMQRARDPLFSVAPWLAAGGAGALGRHFANKQQTEDAPRPSLFQLPEKTGGFF